MWKKKINFSCVVYIAAVYQNYCYMDGFNLIHIHGL